MTTDELRTWMKALEERDVRIVALEKRLAALEAFAQPPRMVAREGDPYLRRWLTENRFFEQTATEDDKAFRERFQEAFAYKQPLQSDEAFQRELSKKLAGIAGDPNCPDCVARRPHATHIAGEPLERGPHPQPEQTTDDKPTLSCPELGTMSLEGASPHMIHVAQETLSRVLENGRRGRPAYYGWGYANASHLTNRMLNGPGQKSWRSHVLVWACHKQGQFSAAEVEALKESGWGQWLR